MKSSVWYTFVMESFITPSQNISLGSGLEWQHFANLSRPEIRQRWQTPTGQGILKSLHAGRFSRQTLEQYIGKFDGKFDLRGIPLNDADLSGLDLSEIEFFYADFSGGNFRNCNFTNSHLSECNLSGANFDWAVLENTLLDNVKFDRYTSFQGVDLHKVNFTFATLLYDLALSQQRIQQLEEHHRWFARFLWLSSDYGRSFSRYFIWVAIFIFGYAAIYYLLDEPATPCNFLDYLYFSVVTFATVGYGDIVMVSAIGKMVVISEIILGYLMGGLLVAILAKRVIG
jgi:hypothetical protein